MKKPVAILIGALVLAGGSVGSLMLVQNKKNSEQKAVQEQLEDNKLFRFDADSVTKLEFTCDEGEYVVEKNEDGKWLLTNRSDFSIDQIYIQLIRTYTADLTAEVSYGEATDENKAMYGLDNPQKIVITEPKGEHTLYLGGKSPTGDYYYVMTEDKKNVYAIQSLYGSALFADRLTLKAKDLVPYELFDIKEIIIKKDGKVTCDLEHDKENDEWSIDKKYDMLRVDATSISKELNNIIRLQADEMLDENLEDLGKYGFDKPDGEVVIKSEDGGEWGFKVKVMEEDPSYAYVLLENDNQVEIYYSFDLDIINMSTYDFISHKIQGEDMFDTESISLELGDESYDIQLNVDERTCTINGSPVEIADTEGYTAFQNFYSSFASWEIAGIDADAKPDKDDTVLTAVFKTKSNGDSKIEIVKGSDDRYYILKDGKYTCAYANEGRFTGRTSVAEFLSKLVTK